MSAIAITTKTSLNVGDAFQPDEVWQTPRGYLYRVMGYEHKPGKRKQAVLRIGSDGSGRKVLRDWDAVSGWVIHQRADAPLSLPAGHLEK